MRSLDNLQLQSHEQENSSEAKSILHNLLKHNASLTPFEQRRELTVSFSESDSQSKEKRLVAGLNGFSLWNWLYIRLLWVDADFRGQGLGAKLMQEAEAIAQQRSCPNVWVDTFIPEARDFYLRLGYEVFGELPDHPKGLTRYFLKKHL